MTATMHDPRWARLAQQVVPHGDLRRTWPLSGGISATMTACEVAAPDGQLMRLIVRRPSDGVLRRNPSAARDEFRLLQATHRLGLATPTPYLLDESGAVFDAPYLVIEYIEGGPDFAPADGTDYVRQCATQLARIHGVDAARLELPFLAQRAADAADDFGAYPVRAADTLDARRIYDTLAAVWPLPSRHAPALLHGDFWPGNLLWRDGQLVAVIDWEDAKLGDPLNDLAISRLDMLCIFGMEAMQAFTYYYQTVAAVDMTHLPYWDLYAALRLVRLADADFDAWAAFYPPFGRPDITAQTMLDHTRAFIDQAAAMLAAPG